MPVGFDTKTFNTASRQGSPSRGATSAALASKDLPFFLELRGFLRITVSVLAAVTMFDREEYNRSLKALRETLDRPRRL